MNATGKPRSFSGFAAFVIAVASLMVTSSSLAQQSLQALHNHVKPAITNRSATLAGSLSATQKLNFTLVLPLRNQNKLTNLLTRLYDPSSPDYHHYLSVAEFTNQFAPTVEDYQSALAFARKNNLTVVDTPENRLIVPLNGTVAQIEQALNVKMNVYQHPTEDRTFYSPDREPSLALSVPLTHIAGLDNFSIPRPTLTKAIAEDALAVTGAFGSGPSSQYLGSDMRAAYYGGTALTGSGQTVGLFEFAGYNLSDVDLTFSSAGQSYSVPINNVVLDGANPGSDGNFNHEAEVVLDIAQAIAMAPGLSQIRVYIGSSDTDIFDKMATENIAKQISISWVWDDNAISDDPIFQEMAAQGQSIFTASGDWGSYPSSSTPLYFPAEDAYVTAVGGTSLTTNGADGTLLSESAWSDSGGGISPHDIVIPSWQAGLANSSNGASTTYRNIPDVSAEGDYDNYTCEMGSCGGGWGGTSFASPRWAGYTALINQQSVAAGNSTVGFLNPSIYAIGKGSNYGSDLHDVVSGSNGGFNAVTGYDLVTGWGSPNGQNLINALSDSPSPSPVNSGCHVVYDITAAWTGYFTANISIHNTSSADISNWNLSWTYANGQTIASNWNGALTQTGSSVTVNNLAYNGSIPAGGEYDGLGLTATVASTNNAPTSFTLNGVTCN